MSDFGFGDADPEDAYSVDDPPIERLRVLRLWVASIALEAARGDADRVRVFRRIQEARWAVGLLRAASGLNRRQRRARILLSEWLDDLLAEEED